MTLPQLEQEVLALIAAATKRTAAELAGNPRHADGTMAIDSQLAVFALARVGDIVGRPKLINLSKLDAAGRNNLRSIAGVARLVRNALDPTTSTSGGAA